MSKKLLCPTTLLFALGVGYWLGAQTEPSPAPTPDLGTRVAPPQAAPRTPREARKSGPSRKSERPTAAATASPALKPTPASPQVAVAYEAVPPAREPQRTGAALIEAFLAILPSKSGDEELDRVDHLWSLLQEQRNLPGLP